MSPEKCIKVALVNVENMKNIDISQCIIDLWKSKKRKKIHMLIEIILKGNTKMKLEVFSLGLIDNYLKKTYETLIWYMKSAARLLYAQQLTNTNIPIMEECTVKMTELAEMGGNDY